MEEVQKGKPNHASKSISQSKLEVYKSQSSVMFKVLRMEIYCHTKKSREEWIFDEQKSETSCQWVKSTKYLSLIQPRDHGGTDPVYTQNTLIWKESE